MTGRLFRVGPDRWRLVYDLPRGADGKRRQRTETITATKGAAERALREAIRSVERGEHVEDRALTIAALFDRCFAAWEPRLASTTMQRYRVLYRHQIHGELGGVTLEQLRPLHLEAAYAKWRADGRRDGRGAGLSERSLLHLHRVLRRALAQAVRWNLVPRNVADSVDAPAPPRTVAKALDATQTAKLLSEAQRRSRYHAVFAFLLGTGARRGEALALRWSDVDLDRATVTIRRAIVKTREHGLEFKGPKSGRARTFAIPAFVVDVLRFHRVEQAKARLAIGAACDAAADLVFATRAGAPIPPYRVSGAFDRLVATLDVPRVRLHDLRHTHASLLGQAGVTLKLASERLGHSTVAITGDLYSHVFEPHDREAAGAFDRLLGGAGVASANDAAARESLVRGAASA